MREVFEARERWRGEPAPLALATLVAVHGSAPRLPGARMLITADGRMAGSVSGGCVEGDVVARAGAVLASGAPVLATYGIADDSELAVGLACAEIEVFIEPFHERPAFAAVRAALARQEPVVLAVVVAPAEIAGRALAVGVGGVVGSVGAGGAARSADAGDVVEAGGMGAGGAAVVEAARGMLESGAVSELFVAMEGREARVFLQAFPRPDRLVICGGSHVAVVLARLARELAMHVTVVDARSAYVTRERFPDADGLVHAPPGTFLAGLDLGGVAVVSLTHDLKLDVPTLAAALRGGAAYVGAMGSLKTHGLRRAALADQGFDAAALGRVRTPIGLDIGSRTPEEIALAILAEIVAVRAGRDARPLREHGVVHEPRDARARAGRRP
jgi:xanthine dehydrogenase accessory factor